MKMYMSKSRKEHLNEYVFQVMIDGAMITSLNGNSPGLIFRAWTHCSTLATKPRNQPHETKYICWNAPCLTLLKIIMKQN